MTTPSNPRTRRPSRGGWLARAPVADPVDLRNAVMLQVLLLLLASLPPLMWAYRLGMVDIPWRPGETGALLSSLTVSAVAIGGVWLIRRGRFQLAVRIVLVVAAVAAMLAYLTQGYGANRFEQPIQVVWLVVAGLMVGRRALWLMFGWTLLAFALGLRVDLADAPAADVWAYAGDAVIDGLIFLFITLVVDRSVTALREALNEARGRAQDLAQANQRLRDEMDARMRTQDQLIHAQKVEAVGRLSSGLAHDFNHLLGLVLGYVQRARDGRSAEDRTEALEGIEGAARRASAVSRQLLNFSRHDVTNIEQLELCSALEDMRPMLQQLFVRETTVTLDLPGDACFIEFDRAHLDLVVLNIASNARDAMDAAGQFTVTVNLPDPGRVVIELADSGSGVPEAMRERVFDPFVTTKPGSQGTGLGLSVVKDLVQQAGGSVRLDSTPGQGTVLTIELPAAPAP